MNGGTNAVHMAGIDGVCRQIRGGTTIDVRCIEQECLGMWGRGGGRHRCGRHLSCNLSDGVLIDIVVGVQCRIHMEFKQPSTASHAQRQVLLGKF